MAISSFIPKVWSARLQENFHKALVFGSLCSRNYEGEISQWGDTVHISNLSDITVRPYDPTTDLAEPEALSGTDIVLTIDHGAYYNFLIGDVDAAQARVDLMDGAMRNAAYQLAEDAEKYILATIRKGAGTKVSGAIPTADKGGLYGLLISIKNALDLKHVPRFERKLIVPIAIEGQLLMDERFVNGSAAAEARLQAIPNDDRGAEWNFLYGVVLMATGRPFDGRACLERACAMAPGNMEYRAARDRAANVSYGSWNPSAQTDTDCVGCSCGDLCTTMLCLNCLCSGCR